MTYYPNETVLQGNEIELKIKQIPIYHEETYRIKKSPSI